tara:strand:+ start:2787 stop:3062 length:276 start_codon:yes stop_codon:yes gene_type:complete
MRKTKDGKVILSDQGGKYTVEYGKDAMPYENTGNGTDELFLHKVDNEKKEFVELMTEIGWQIECLNEGISDKDDFIQAINEIHEYYNTSIL